MSLIIKLIKALLYENQQSNSPNQGKLYSRFISILKFLHIGYIVVFIIGCLLSLEPLFIGIYSFGSVILIVVFGCSSIYISTQGFIAIVDILSHIEDNTRHLKSLREDPNYLIDIDNNIANILDSLESIENKL